MDDDLIKHLIEVIYVFCPSINVNVGHICCHLMIDLKLKNYIQNNVFSDLTLTFTIR